MTVLPKESVKIRSADQSTDR